MSPLPRNSRSALIAGALVVAAGLGFVLARLTSGPPGTAPAQQALPTGDAPAPLEISDSSLTMMAIALETVTPGSLSAEIQAPATVSAAPNGQAIVTARAPGTLMRLNKRLGDQVAAGEVLALVESRDAATMAAERSAAESKVELARSIFKREQSLYEQKVTPRQDFETAQS